RLADQQHVPVHHRYHHHRAGVVEHNAGHHGAVEPPVECAARELAEEVGRAAGRWTAWGGFFTAPAILTEYIHCFLAEDLTATDAGHADEDEQIEVVPWPVGDLDSLIARVEDAKSLIGLLRLRATRG
ncbi:MAG: NUDIX hydrolase, partial [Miltoncostaeaceae bacterium]